MSEPVRPLEPAEPTLFHRLAEWLGTGRLESDRDLIRVVQDRLPTATVDRLVQHGLTAEEVHRLVIPRRTLSHRRAADEPLTVEESDRAVRFARVGPVPRASSANATKHCAGSESRRSGSTSVRLSTCSRPTRAPGSSSRPCARSSTAFSPIDRLAHQHPQDARRARRSLRPWSVAQPGTTDRVLRAQSGNGAPRDAGPHGNRSRGSAFTLHALANPGSGWRRQ